MKRYVQLGFVLVMLAFVSTITFTLPNQGSFLWAGRGLFGLLIAGGSLILSAPFSVAFGMMVIPADLAFIAQSPNSLDLLIWASYILIPIVVSRYVAEYVPESEPSRTEQPDEDTPDSPRTLENVELHPDVQEDTFDPSERLQELIVKRLRTVHSELEADNLLYFHVRDQEARPGYVIDQLGSVDSKCEITKDQAQGIGWVLRHGEQLILEDNKIDWRNLRYHNKPVDLDHVRITPVSPENDMLGVLVIEWKQSVELDDEFFDHFLEELEVLMSVDRSVRQLERKEREVDLLRRLSEINPFSSDRIETLQQKIKDMVRDLIPADHVAFFDRGTNDEESKVVKQRRLFYQKCREWIRTNDKVLRINNVDNFSFKGTRFGKVAPPDVSSFLGGAISENEEVFGFVCLDDPAESFFSEEEEKLLETLLNRASGMMKIAKTVSELRVNQQKIETWLNKIRELSLPDDEDNFFDELVGIFADQLPVEEVEFYSRAGDRFHLKGVSGEQVGSGEIHSKSALTTRLKDCTGQECVNFPSLRRLDDFKIRKSIDHLTVCPAFRSDDSLCGFLCLFSQSQFSDSTEKEISHVWPLLEREFSQSLRSKKLHKQAVRDSWTGFPRYDVWKRRLASDLAKDDMSSIRLWCFKIPGFDQIFENRGRQRTQQWIRSLTNRLENEFDSSRITRAHGTVFYGFSPIDENKLSSILTKMRDEIYEWSFPLGSWPDEPRFVSLSYQKPFPDTETMIDSTRKRLLTNAESDEKTKGKAPDGV